MSMLLIPQTAAGFDCDFVVFWFYYPFVSDEISLIRLGGWGACSWWCHLFFVVLVVLPRLCPWR